MSTLNSDGSAADTQAKITASVAGDTVKLPAAGSFTWTTVVEIAIAKHAILDLNGSTVTLQGANGALWLQAHATGNNRITNGSIVKSGVLNTNGPFFIGDQRGMAAVRVDHITFSSVGTDVPHGTIIDMHGRGPGVMEHCTFNGLLESHEFIHLIGWYGGGDLSGWTLDAGSALAGSANIFYIEDCTFNGISSNVNTPQIQGYYGSRICIRKCVMNGIMVDMHGTGGSVGARWWEMYDNQFNTTNSSNQSWSFNMRAGSGVIHHNSKVGGTRPCNIGLCEEDSVYPADYQIGRGLNQTSDVAYVWLNTGISSSLNACDALGQPGMVQETRDVVTTGAIRSGYTAYIYPHPLNSGGSSGGGGGGTDPAHPAGSATYYSGNLSEQFANTYYSGTENFI